MKWNKETKTLEGSPEEFKIFLGFEKREITKTETQQKPHKVVKASTGKKWANWEKEILFKYYLDPRHLTKEGKQMKKKSKKYLMRELPHRSKSAICSMASILKGRN